MVIMQCLVMLVMAIMINVPVTRVVGHAQTANTVITIT